MPKVGQVDDDDVTDSTEITPYWQTRDDSIRLYCGDVLDVLRKMPSGSVHCVMTSPPYYALRAYHGVDKEKEIGSERTYREFVAKMVEVFAEVRRVLRDEGSLYCNLGDSYNQNHGKGFKSNNARGYKNTKNDFMCGDG